MESIGAADVELTTEDLREIENAGSEVTVQGITTRRICSGGSTAE
jgi:hypothetical protein